MARAVYENSREIFGETRTADTKVFRQEQDAGATAAYNTGRGGFTAGRRCLGYLGGISPKRGYVVVHACLCIGTCRSGAEDRGGGGRRESAALPRAENNNKKEKKNGNYNYDFMCVRGLPIGPCAWCPWRGQRIENRI